MFKSTLFIMVSLFAVNVNATPLVDTPFSIAVGDEVNSTTNKVETVIQFENGDKPITVEDIQVDDDQCIAAVKIPTDFKVDPNVAFLLHFAPSKNKSCNFKHIYVKTDLGNYVIDNK